MTARARVKRKAPLYLLKGAEWAIAPYVAVTQLQITELGPAVPPERTLLAHGHIWLTDFAEDTKWQDKWQALWVLPELEVLTSGVSGVDAYQQWYRQQQAERYDLGWRVRKRGSADADFTLAADVNAAIAGFIALHLCRYCVWIGGKESLPRLVTTPKRYSGPMRRYEGICLCAVIGQSALHDPFPWKNVTHGHFPKRCFECSCGRRWWEVDPEEYQWTPVGDAPTWRCLTQYNGEPVKQLCYLAGTVRLLGPLVHRGVVPIALPSCEPKPRIITP